MSVTRTVEGETIILFVDAAGQPRKFRLSNESAAALLWCLETTADE